MAESEKDALTGKTTTGHEWDGIRELNTPLPRWWLYTFYACILWAVGYWVLYPAWPSLSGYTKGILGYSSRAALADELEAAKQDRSVWLERFEEASVNEIAKDPELLNYAMAGGRMIFAENCAPCHGYSGSGTPGFPVLADDDWLWGGTLEDIQTTITFGIRGTHEDTRSSDMPSFDADEELDSKEIEGIADYVLSLSQGGTTAKTGKKEDDDDEGDEGKEHFEESCSACHGEDGKGLQEMGAPNLTDGIWLYGEGRDAIIRQVIKPKHGVMPTWGGRLDEVSIKQATVYVHSLGGGK